MQSKQCMEPSYHLNAKYTVKFHVKMQPSLLSILHFPYWYESQTTLP